MKRWQILGGDVRETLRALPDQCVQTCVTSPPYFGLRDYGVAGQIGLEQTPQEYVEQMVAVFREVRRVLRDDGTLWLNLGDSYAAQRSGTTMPASTLHGGVGGKGDDSAHRGMGSAHAHRDAKAIGLKHKDLIGIPWRVAFALQADGWWLRQDIIWHKPNPMPESVRDRCTKAHEYIFPLSKSERYFWDVEAMKEPAVKGPQRMQADPETVKQKAVGPHARGEEGFNHQYADSERVWAADGMRNRRSVWTVATRPYKGAHFATFPPALIEPCVLAGAPFDGLVLDPFTGSGTTAAVALQHGRRFIGCELNPDYIKLAEARIAAAEAEVLW